MRHQPVALSVPVYRGAQHLAQVRQEIYGRDFRQGARDVQHGHAITVSLRSSQVIRCAGRVVDEESRNRQCPVQSAQAIVHGDVFEVFRQDRVHIHRRAERRLCRETPVPVFLPGRDHLYPHVVLMLHLPDVLLHDHDGRGKVLRPAVVPR